MKVDKSIALQLHNLAACNTLFVGVDKNTCLLRCRNEDKTFQIILALSRIISSSWIKNY